MNTAHFEIFESLKNPGKFNIFDTAKGRFVRMGLPKDSAEEEAGKLNDLFPLKAERLPTRVEAASAAELLRRCNGHDLDVWTGGEWPVDADLFLRPLASP